jgi:outer membrane biosynthesis protein TonB
MQMRAAQLLTSIRTWRWSPCVAIIAATLLYVVVATAVVPDDILSDETRSGPRLDGATPLGIPRAMPLVSPGDELDEPADGPNANRRITPATPSRSPRVSAAQSPLLRRRGFSPPIDQPDIAVAPIPPPPVIPAPTPAEQAEPEPEEEAEVEQEQPVEQEQAPAEGEVPPPVPGQPPPAPEQAAPGDAGADGPAGVQGAIAGAASRLLRMNARPPPSEPE